MIGGEASGSMRILSRWLEARIDELMPLIYETIAPMNCSLQANDSAKQGPKQVRQSRRAVAGIWPVLPPP
jgi:hypothetical protein